MDNKSIWISWENQRRSIELAKALGIEIFIFSKLGKSRVKNYFQKTFQTLVLLTNQKPKVVFAQNPSIVLATVLCLVRHLYKYRLIVDRHSNFKLDRRPIGKYRVFHLLSKYTVKSADLTIVTNEYLKNLVNTWGGRGLVLQDKIPSLKANIPIKLKGKHNITYVCSFSEDEPVSDVIAAAKILGGDFFIYITGKKEKYFKNIEYYGTLPENVELTGYLNNDAYINYLNSSDVVMVLTKQEHTLTCGAYEAVSLGKPMVLSETETIKDYFYKGAIYCFPEPGSIASSVRECINNASALKKDVQGLKSELDKKWSKEFVKMVAIAFSYK